MSSQWQFNIIVVFVQQTDYESIHCINCPSPKIGCQSIADNTPAFHQALLTVQWYPYSFLFQGGLRHCESEWGVLHKNTLTWLLLTVGIQYPEFNILTIGQPHHQWRDVFEELMQKQCITDNFYKYMSVMISISQKETIIHLKPTVWTLLKNLGFLGLYLSDHRYVCGKKIIIFTIVIRRNLKQSSLLPVKSHLHHFYPFMYTGISNLLRDRNRNIKWFFISPHAFTSFCCNHSCWCCTLVLYQITEI